MTRNPGFYNWVVEDITSFSLPQYFKLITNDTSVVSPTVDSGGFYIEPSNYPTTTLQSRSTETPRIIYPLKSDIDSFRFNDTIIFQWYPPLSKADVVVMLLRCETYVAGDSTSGFSIAGTSVKSIFLMISKRKLEFRKPFGHADQARRNFVLHHIEPYVAD